MVIKIKSRLHGSEALNGGENVIERVVRHELARNLQHVGEELAAEESVRMGLLATNL